MQNLFPLFLPLNQEERPSTPAVLNVTRVLYNQILKLLQHAQNSLLEDAEEETIGKDDVEEEKIFDDRESEREVYLPEDLLVEILSRVPEASLARFRSTSKGWNALIKKDGSLAKNSLFVMLIYHKVYLVKLNVHGIHNNNFEKVISQFSLCDPLSTSSMKEVGIRSVFHCDGLLLCTTMDNTLVVWNPCSGETSRIIKPRNIHNGSDTYALGKSTCNNEYKILRVHHHGYGCRPLRLVEYEIYDFTANSWSVVGEARDWFIAERQGTCVDGNTYWLTSTYSPTEMKSALRCFDYSTERFGCVSLPVDPLSYNVYGLSVTREEQNLCLLTSRKVVHDIDVWMATKVKGTGDMSWSKLLTVKRIHSQQFIAFHVGMSFSVDRVSKVLLHPTKFKNSSNCLHIVGENYEHIKVDLRDVESKRSNHVKRAPTLVQIQQGSLGLGTWKVAPATKFS
ncbi:putative F-box protein At4g10190 [Raphanus sativus]|uniref:F-box protein At4g10190 n=1 Tax=Raphanus sativus TaxID=3726 RepID=A0A9W3BQL2_RAPSA|nr:putative F-box protein At4g10190 [Raphanus sativus]